jgi:hypothetical protein
LLRVFMGIVAALVAACTTMGERPVPAFDDAEANDAGSVLPRVDRAIPLHGIPNRGRDPSVVVIGKAIVGQDVIEPLCVGTLISPRLVLSAASCVAECSAEAVADATDPTTLVILAGEEARSARRVARGGEILAPEVGPSCDGGVAVLVLDEAVLTIKPLALRARGPAVGDHVRTVGYADAYGDLHRIFREHASVIDVSDAEVAIAEAACRGAPGGPALDEDTGEIIGVLTRAGPSCDGPRVHNVYARIDAFAAVVEAAFARVEALDEEEKLDAGSTAAVRAAKRGTKAKPPSDVGSACATGAECAAGVCVTETGLERAAVATRRYCSRGCGEGDRCPTRYHCKPVAGAEPSATACINMR